MHLLVQRLRPRPLPELAARGNGGRVPHHAAGGHEMSVTRAFTEGRLEWICSDVFFMDGGLPMRDYWMRRKPPAGSAEAERYVVTDDGRLVPNAQARRLSEKQSADAYHGE